MFRENVHIERKSVAILKKSVNLNFKLFKTVAFCVKYI